MEISTLFTTTGITDSRRMLHTPGEFAKKNLLYVQEVGELKSLQPHKSQREKLSSFLFLGVLRGTGTVSVGKEAFQVKQGSCMLINCMQYYAHESSREDPWELMWVHFNGNIANEYFELFMERNGQKNIFHSEKIETLRELILKLMALQEEKDLESELLSGEILLELMNECLLSAMGRELGPQENHKNICNEIREAVNRNYKDAALLKGFTERFGMGEESLDQCFLQTYGITLKDYILNRKFTAAKELLRFSVMPVKDIIEESGIRNEDLFRRLFKDGEGMTAEEYRMKWAQWVK